LFLRFRGQSIFQRLRPVATTGLHKASTLPGRSSSQPRHLEHGVFRLLPQDRAEPVRHVDVDRRAWVDGAIASGLPTEYGEMLLLLTQTIASGGG